MNPREVVRCECTSISVVRQCAARSVYAPARTRPVRLGEAGRDSEGDRRSRTAGRRIPGSPRPRASTTSSRASAGRSAGPGPTCRTRSPLCPASGRASDGRARRTRCQCAGTAEQCVARSDGSAALPRLLRQTRRSGRLPAPRGRWSTAESRSTHRPCERSRRRRARTRPAVPGRCPRSPSGRRTAGYCGIPTTRHTPTDKPIRAAGSRPPFAFRRVTGAVFRPSPPYTLSAGPARRGESAISAPESRHEYDHRHRPTRRRQRGADRPRANGRADRRFDRHPGPAAGGRESHPVVSASGRWPDGGWPKCWPGWTPAARTAD